MKVLFCASEALPFAATGGLADVAGSLPTALRTRLVGCRVVMPLYESVPQELRDKMRFVTSISVPVAWRRQYCGIFEAKVGNVIYYLIDNQYYFKRTGFYGHYDDAERFAFFSRAIIEMLPYIDFKPDRENAYAPMWTTVSGSSADSSELHWKNARRSMRVSPFGNSITFTAVRKNA